MKKLFIISCFLLTAFCFSGQTYGFEWAKLISSPSDEAATCMTLDNQGNVYVAGYFYDVADMDPGPGTYTFASLINSTQDLFISKFDPQGNFIWAKQLSGNNVKYATAIDVSNTGEVSLTGWFKGVLDFDPGASTYTLNAHGSNLDGFALKLDNLGNFQWAVNYGSLAGAGTHGKSIQFDSMGNVYIGGQFTDTVDFDPGPLLFTLGAPPGIPNVFILKFSAGGTFQWAKQVGLNGTCWISGMVLDENGNIFSTGTAGSLTQGPDFDPGPGTYTLTGIYISKLDSQGNFMWAKSYGNVDIESRGMDLDTNGNIYSIGVFALMNDFAPGPNTYTMTTTTNNYNAYFLKTDPNGNFIWAKQIGSVVDEGAFAICVDKQGSVYGTGFFVAAADFDPGPTSYTMVPSATEGNMWLTALDINGDFVWAKHFGSMAGCEASSVKVDTLYNIYTAGYVTGTAMDFDTEATTYTLSADLKDGFIHKISQCIYPTIPSNITPSVNLFFCSPSSTTLFATGNGTLSWYTSLTSTSSIGTGTSLVTSLLNYGVHIFYVGAVLCDESLSRTAVSVTISACTNLNEVYVENELIVFPNPTEGEFTVKGAEKGVYSIIDVLGREIISFQVNRDNEKIDMAKIGTGVYYLIGKNVKRKLIIH